MISFCRSSFHSILGMPESDDRQNPFHRWSDILAPPDRRGLHLLATDSSKPHHVVESPDVPPATASEKPADPGAWGLHEASMSTGGLDLCTESLGSESCDCGIEIGDADESVAEIKKQNTRRTSRQRSVEMRFPPPLPWMMGRGGRRSRFLKSERKDGRFVLTEIEIDQPPEMLRAIRIDGRLRLELVRMDAGEGEAIDSLKGEEKSANTVEIPGEEESEQNGERWELLRVMNEGQRCVEAVSGDGGTPLWWRHRFLTTA